MKLNVFGNTKIETKSLIGSYDDLHKIKLEILLHIKEQNLNVHHMTLLETVSVRKKVNLNLVKKEFWCFLPSAYLSHDGYEL